jgi:DNA (cytosine-5)-methyltransferase 1
LWREFARVVSEVRPEWVVVENVASGAKLWLDTVVRDLGEQGYACLPIPLSAAGVGAPHLRRRIFVVAHADSVGCGSRRARRASAFGEGWRPIASEGIVAHAERELVREQPGRISGQSRSGAREFAHAREEGLAANADADGQHALTVDAEVALASEPSGDTAGSGRGARGHAAREDRCERWSWNGSSDPSWRAPEPCIRRVDDGLPRAMDRLRALGNAVVPQCAEVVGHVIRELMR